MAGFPDDEFHSEVSEPLKTQCLTVRRKPAEISVSMGFMIGFIITQISLNSYQQML
jgi:hypothetical protein